jgi:hypothetical protein
VEASLQGYTGRYALASDQRSAGATYNLGNYLDRRAAASFIFYPQPFGIQAEYNIGMSPQYSAATHNIVNGHLHGGYIQLMLRERWFGQQFIPFIRYQRYSGGMKSQADARYEFVSSAEAGVEWQPNPYLEFTTEVDHSQRNTSDAANPDNRQIGTIFRLQLQVNY